MNKIIIFLTVLFIIKNISASEEVINRVKPYLPANPIILEAGAYNGDESIRMADFWKDGHVYSFEPVPELYSTLNNRKAGRTNLDFYEFALGDFVGTSQMHISAWTDKPGIPSGSSSLLKPKEHLTLAPHVMFYEIIDVPVTTIDKWASENGVDHIDFMYLDMQGYELNALKASPKIFSTVKVVVTEVEFVEAYEGQYQYNDVKNWLENQGFRLLTTLNNYGWFADAIFVRS